MICEAAAKEIKQYIAEIWVKTYPRHTWTYWGERTITEEGYSQALERTAKENKLNCFADYKVKIREADQYRPKIKGWR